jgi:hypothetical protein
MKAVNFFRAAALTEGGEGVGEGGGPGRSEHDPSDAVNVSASSRIIVGGDLSTSGEPFATVQVRAPFSR